MEPGGEAEKNAKGHFIYIKNNLIEVVPFPRGYFDHFLLAFSLFVPKPYDLRG